MIQKAANIIATGSYVPDTILNNSYFEGIVDTSDKWIVSRTGIKERRRANIEIATSDIATKAAERAIESANISPLELDIIIVATVTPDMPFPSTACLVQKNIGAKNATAFDIEAACSGFIYGLSIGESFIKSGSAKNILIIGAEVLTRITDYSDRNTCVLFGDGAGAVILSDKKGHRILSNYLGSDGKGCDLLYLPGGGSKTPASIDTINKSLHYIRMEGSEVFKFAVRIMESATKQVLESCKLKTENISLLIPHQANIRIIESASKRFNLPEDKIYINVDKYGNMSSASIAVALDEAYKEGRITSGDIVVLVAFGGGLTWGSSVIRWS